VPLLRTPEGVDIAWYDLGGSGDPVLLCHATGFHAHAWLPVAERLAAAGFHCFAFDQRGHGDSPTPANGDFAWEGNGRDALAVLDAAGLDQPFAVGHSGGGALLLLAEQQRPGAFRSLYLYEPIVPPEGPGFPDPTRPGGGRDLPEGALRRREVFESRQAAYDNYASKPPFDGLDPAVLRAYVDHGFDDLADGTVRLKCRGADEAATYRAGMQHHAFSHLGDVACPTVVACGAHTDVFGPAVMDVLAERLPHGRAEVFDDLGHFGPLEDPAAVATAIADAFTPH
jgi:pimeloyl-ACP methyl ester carboxylesterase